MLHFLASEPIAFKYLDLMTTMPSKPSLSLQERGAISQHTLRSWIRTNVPVVLRIALSVLLRLLAHATAGASVTGRQNGPEALRRRLNEPAGRGRSCSARHGAGGVDGPVDAKPSPTQREVLRSVTPLLRWVWGRCFECNPLETYLGSRSDDPQRLVIQGMR